MLQKAFPIRFRPGQLLASALLWLLLASLLAACGTSAASSVQSQAPTTVSLAEETSATSSPTATTAVEAAAETTTAVTVVSTSTAATTAATTTAAATAAASSATSAPVDLQAAGALHQRAIVVDTHNDTMMKVINEDSWLPSVNLAGSTSFMVDLPKLTSGGVDIATFACYTTGYALTGGGQDFTQANSRLLALLNATQWTLANNPGTTALILTRADIDSAVAAGKTGFISSIEGAYSFNTDNAIALLRQYYDLGVRMLAPVWNNANALGEGTSEIYKDGTASSGGLTELGAAVITEMNRLGIVVDVSHMNEETFWEAMAVTQAPVIASHSSAYALCANTRNLKDDQIQAVAAAGGVIQVNFHRPFLSENADSVTIATLVDHIDYIVRLAGVDHVGLGSDFDGAKMPQGLDSAAQVPQITVELLKRGYSEEDIDKILGGNALRVFGEVWGSAPAVSATPAIQPALAMGSPVESATPLLTATVSPAAGLDPASLQVIVDGISYIPAYDEATATVSLALPAPLQRKFHVVTFTAALAGGAAARATRIYYVS